MPPSLFNDPRYVRKKAVIEGADLFDAAFFGFNPGEAEIIDPQQRLFLEASREVLDTAGYNPDGYSGLIGVFGGCSLNSYLLSNLLPNREVVDRLGGYQIMISSDKDFLTTRVSYKLNLKGPSVNVQTACSTSLVAVHMACQSLLNYECDMAIAGGVSVGFPQKIGYLFQDGMIMSPDGRCRPFDARAQGIVAGEGVGVVLLKRLSEALDDRDHIRAVIKGSAINNDGSCKVGYTAPSIDGQAEVIAAALEMAGVEAANIGYLEAHGTGTPLGDPIEVAALTKAFNAGAKANKYCALGSVKGNIGHLDAAAGVASLIKTILALENKEIPPSLHFETPNPEIDFENGPFYVNSKLSEWKTTGGPRLAGVSSFGIGGTNAHVVVEESPTQRPPEPSRVLQLLAISARNEDALTALTTEYAAHFKNRPDQNVADAAYTLQTGRRRFPHRRIAVCYGAEDAVSCLQTLDAGNVFTAANDYENRRIAFLFSGQGSQHVNMGLELYRSESAFREHVDRCSEILLPMLGFDLRGVLYPKTGEADGAARRLSETELAQPALFVIEYALARLWEEWGIRPCAMIGHSIGEYVAACLAEVFSLEEALELVAARGRLIQSLPHGAMTAVTLAEQELLPLLGERLSLAVVNAPALCVISGVESSVSALEEEFLAKGVQFVRLHTSHAFHSKQMEPILPDFLKLVENVRLRPPRIKYLSNVTGAWITDAQATDPDYWATHLRRTVRFDDGVEAMLRDTDSVLLEVGPGRALTTIVEQRSKQAGDRAVLASMRHPNNPESDLGHLLKTLGRLWLEGADVDWEGFYKRERRSRVPLPATPLDRRSYWIAPSAVSPDAGEAAPPDSPQGFSDWFCAPSWRQSVPPRRAKSAAGGAQPLQWLIFQDRYGLARVLADRLSADGHLVVNVSSGAGFAQADQRNFVVDPYSSGDYQELAAQLDRSGALPTRVLNLWSVAADAGPSEAPQSSGADRTDHAGFYSLLFLTQALEAVGVKDQVFFDVISNDLYDVSGEERLQPELATVLGACKVLPQEAFWARCRNIDFSSRTPGDFANEDLADRLLTEILHESEEMTVVYRGKKRWVPAYERVQLDACVGDTPALLRTNGVYLITGGLGALGLALAEYLARAVKAKVLLLGRSAFPPREKWEEWLETHNGSDRTASKIRKLKWIESLGGRVAVLGADVADFQQMEQAVSKATEEFGAVNGVIHAAGVPGGSIIQRTTREIAESVFAPKIIGTRVLQQIFKKENLDFMVLYSSINAIIGMIGQAAYSAANLYLDAFASAYSAANGVFVTSINWDTWREIGMAVETEVPAAFRKAREEALENGISTEQGLEIFRRVLDSGLSRVVISTRDLDGRIGAMSGMIDAWQDRRRREKTEEPKTRYARPQLSSEYLAPRNEFEQAVAGVWGELLNIDGIGTRDDFFELGGHSLLGTQVMSRIYRRFDVQLPLKVLFEARTVEALAGVLRSLLPGSVRSETFDENGSQEEREVIEL